MSQAAQDTARNEAEIRALIAAWVRALEAKDAAGLVAACAPDVVLYDVKPPYRLDGAPAYRAMWEACLPYFPKRFRAHHHDLDLTVGGDAAFARGLFRMEPIDEVSPIGDSFFRVTICYRRLGGRWQVVHEHISLPYDPMTGQVVPITEPAATGVPCRAEDGADGAAGATGADEELAFTLTRHLDAPRALVFRVWAEPEHLREWCRPRDFTVERGAMDFREGGAWSSHIRSAEGTDHRMLGVYREIVPERRIVFTHAWVDPDGERSPETVITVTFEDEGAGTRLTFHQKAFPTPSSRDSHAEGWGEALDYLVAHVRAVHAGTSALP